MSSPQRPIEVTVVMHESEQILVTEVLRRVRAYVSGLRDIHGTECGAEAVETVARELGIDLGPREWEE